ncbi:MAG TPA: leucyl aminopeptidase [Acidobacteriota bacterium]|nr:leucyl aminopeptidase [Acidobacteriota bacterium]
MSHDVQLQLSSLPSSKEETDALVVFLPQGEFTSPSFKELDKHLGGALLKIVNQEKFQAKLGDQIVYQSPNGLNAKRVILSGLGKKEKFSEETVRRAAASAAIAARNIASAKVSYILPAKTKFSEENLVRAIAEGAILGSYRYTKYKTKEEDLEPAKAIKTVSILAPKKTSLQKVLDAAKLATDATCFARDLVNEPPNNLNPATLEEIARKAAQESKLKFRVLQVPELKKLGAGAILGVGSGSNVPPRLIEVSYSSGRKGARKTALVGKGITFDSGGLSLKPSKYMETMKCDMAGAAAVLSTMRALSVLRPKFDVVGILCAAENMPSGSAIRPGDVLRAMNGKTIEVVNTDAEGRLVLADGISWAVKQGATEIIDLATLTGACIIGLGPYVAGAMSNDQGLTDRVIDAGRQVGEPIWQLPVPEEYEFMVKSEIADIKNLAANSEAGAIQGALFLKEFIGEAKWVHLDIAGPAWNEKDFYHTPKNGTGFGVRTLLQFLSKA